MEEYKQYLCTYFNKKCTSEDSFYEYIKDSQYYTHNLNEEGKLHSKYTGTYYEPAIIIKFKDCIRLYWLFDGKIKDCDHPFLIIIDKGVLSSIMYYSSERILTHQPLFIVYRDKKIVARLYNQYIIAGEPVKILDDSHDYLPRTDEEISFTPEFYPLCDPIHMQTMFKFAD